MSSSGGLRMHRRLNPELFLPCAARRNRLEFVIEAIVSKVQRIGDCGHRFDTEEIAGAGGVNDGRRIERAEADFKLSLPGAEQKSNLAIVAADQTGVDVIEFYLTDFYRRFTHRA